MVNKIVPNKDEYNKILVRVFKAEYNRLSPKSCNEYQKIRSRNAPDWRTVAKIYNTTRWTELLKHTGLAPIERNVYTPKVVVVNGVSRIIEQLQQLSRQ